METNHTMETNRPMETNRTVEAHPLNVVRKLGTGGQGTCWLLEQEVTKKLVVLKRIHVASNWSGGPPEQDILSKILIKNRRIVNLIAFRETNGIPELFFNYYSGGDLEKLCHNYKAAQQLLPESFVWHAARQLAEALAFLHYGLGASPVHPKAVVRNWPRVIHRDVKPANIFLEPHPTAGPPCPYPSIVLGDFGASTTSPSNALIGTPCFQPPEIPIANAKTDAWAAGACIYAMANHGRPPIRALPSHIPNTQQNNRIWDADPNSRHVTPITPVYSEQLERVMFGVLNHDPDKRWSSLELLDAILAEYFEAENRPGGSWQPLISFTRE